MTVSCGTVLMSNKLWEKQNHTSLDVNRQEFESRKLSPLKYLFFEWILCSEETRELEVFWIKVFLSFICRWRCRPRFRLRLTWIMSHLLLLWRLAKRHLNKWQLGQLGWIFDAGWLILSFVQIIGEIFFWCDWQTWTEVCWKYVT